MKSIILKIWLLLDKREKKNILLLLLLMVFMAALEMIGVGSIMPFLSVLGKPDIISDSSEISYLYNYLSFESVEGFLAFLAAVSFVILLVSVSFKMLTYYGLFLFINMRRHSISKRLLKSYCSKDYSFFLRVNSNEAVKNILSETDLVINQALLPALKLFSYAIVSLFLIIFLLYIDIKLTLIMVCVFGGYYLFIYLSIRKRVSSISHERVKVNSSRFKLASEILGGIKELKILHRESAVIDGFDSPSEKFARYNATNQTLVNLPQFLLELVLFGVLIILSFLALGGSYEGFGEVLPVLGVYAFAALKLKPAANNIYASLSSMKFASASLDAIVKDLEDSTEALHDCNEQFNLKKAIEIKNLSFSYDEKTSNTLENINLTIKAKSSVGVMGTTGSGKTTFIDLLLGLLSPSGGEILIDNKPLQSEMIAKWQRNIGYVPQTIFLSDDTIASNIAFGIPEESVDWSKIFEVCKIAQLEEFIDKLEDGYHTIVGDRGVRLSGGQKQRIGIARALYHNPEVLILDEATSALDTLTETKIMRAVEKMMGEKTIIIIAHRLSTLDQCDQIIQLEGGHLVQKR